MKYHIHDYKRTGESKHFHYDHSDVEVLTAPCKCRICGKKKDKKFIGHIIGQLGGS